MKPELRVMWDQREEGDPEVKMDSQDRLDPKETKVSLAEQFGQTLPRVNPDNQDLVETLAVMAIQEREDRADPLDLPEYLE